METRSCKGEFNSNTRPRDYDFHAGITQKPLKPAIYKGLNPFPLFHLVDVMGTFHAQKPAQWKFNGWVII